MSKSNLPAQVGSNDGLGHIAALRVDLYDCMDKPQPTHLPCRLCGTAAYVPPVVDGGDHKHHQVACNECSIEVCRLSAAEALDVWNRLMGPNAKVSGPARVRLSAGLGATNYGETR